MNEQNVFTAINKNTCITSKKFLGKLQKSGEKVPV